MSNGEFQDDNIFSQDDSLNRYWFDEPVPFIDSGSFSEPLLDLIELEFNEDLNLGAVSLDRITQIVNDAVALADSYVEEYLDDLETAWQQISDRGINLEIVGEDVLDGWGAFGNSTIFLSEDLI